MKAYWLTCASIGAVEVETDDADVITKASPVARKFVGQPLDALIGWMRKYGGFEYRTLAVQPGLF